MSIGEKRDGAECPRRGSNLGPVCLCVNQAAQASWCVQLVNCQSHPSAYGAVPLGQDLCCQKTFLDLNTLYFHIRKVGVRHED